MVEIDPKVYTTSEVAKHHENDDAWVIVNNKVYDITDFIKSHPGGILVLQEHLGSDVTQQMQDDTFHVHTSSAYSMLTNYYIGDIEGTKQEKNEEIRRGWGKVDMSKPLVNQVGLLGKDYAMWVENDPLHFKDSVLLFHHPIMEMLTRTPWYAVPVVWVPVIVALIGFSIHRGLSTVLIASGFISGLMTWYLIEWVLHRYLFHWWSLAEYGSYYSNIVHFLLHGFHHKVPMDPLRLVLPPIMLVVLSSPFLYIVWTLLPSSGAAVLTAGSYTGYVQYDMIHYWLHHAGRMDEYLPTRLATWWRDLRSHHMVHHFASTENADINYGISNRILDRVFHTLRV
eukprot:gb/GECH01014423.1/.p1 GENE.gb/GECH01014423.1/~~gb/GECH01014423.1/.p1  ORF type:complete len:340 (+),score=38.03 gb/GECH01014423.1/:1-1020(+)